MTLREITPPVLTGPSVIAWDSVVSRAWDSDNHVFYLITNDALLLYIWIHIKEKGIGGRSIDPEFKNWTDFYNRTPRAIPMGTTDSYDPVVRIERWLVREDS